MTTVTRGVTDPELTSVGLYTPLPWPLRLDLLPFCFFYVTAVYLYTVRPPGDVVPWIVGACSVFWHALALLSAEWSADVRCWMSCARLSSSDVAETGQVRLLVKVEPSLAMGPKQLCDCHWTPEIEYKRKKPLENEPMPTLWFSYQNVKFCLYKDVASVCSSRDVQFRRLEFPTSGTLASYLQSKGVGATDELEYATTKWGKNDVQLPMPMFAELLKEQLVAPFFVFQFLCMLLWCLDEYMYYSLLTLLMLVIFECTVVKQRQQNLITLLHMRRAPQPCLVFRSGRWVQVLSDELVPGDLCSVGHDDRDTVVPRFPLRKEAISASILNEEDMLQHLEIDDRSSMKHKRHVLYGGTKILQHTTPRVKELLLVSAPPDGGCVGYVLKTGFGTTQGSLMRTILFSSQRVTANDSEAMWFILLLLNFAVVAAAFVLADGIDDPTRNQFKLFLHCIMIITSVVPPELPMELSLAVTNSLIALTKSNIFCTEPFRIPAAGRIDICCFDKTGTLTSDELKLHGVAGLEKLAEPNDMKRRCSKMDTIGPEHLPLDTELVLAGCQSLVMLNGKVTGDPLEMVAIRSISWCLTSREGEDESLLSVQPSWTSGRRGKIQAVDILHSFSFSSELKRMSTVVCVRKAENDEQDEQRILTKGAPEVLESLFAQKPANYRHVYCHYASKGCRVLALGFRVLPINHSPDELRRKPRHELESALTFVGFLVLDCPLKKDTTQTIRELMVSKHKVIMVTGDNPLTACDVARQVGINAGYSKQPLILTPNAEDGSVCWKSIDDGSPGMEEEVILFDVNEVAKMQVQYDMCVTGEAMTLLYKQQEEKCENNAAALEGFLTTLEKICLCTTVFARTSPQQKEQVILAMKRCGKTTAMCGDGTNDVGALKQAHIGISIVNSSSSGNSPHVVTSGKASSNVAGRGGLRHRRQPGRQEHPADELQQTLYGSDDSQVVRLGDASIASPFTSKSSSIRVIKKLIRQGRCTLVTTIQMYKILGINCLITAYYLSSLFVLGVKNGDQQLTISGLSIAMFFLILSRAKPARKLSHQRPPPGVFCVNVMVSIFGQFVIHLAFLVAALRLAQPFIEPGDPAMHPDGKFTPNVVNSIMFLMSSIMQVNTFVANYRGQPFMEGFWENKLLHRSALFTYAVLAMVIAEVFTPVNAMLELVTMPNQQTQLAVAALMAGDTIVALAFERAVQMIVMASS
uniref:P5A-ATPase transmembrane helical hairpin domain-containing protein n=1 Tax=Hyaloperonospora arabidopsidis (strain Emoy2) TaxID=559515 RepID=M4BEL3_HYAAE